MTNNERKIILAEHETFETERLVLRKVEITDAADIFEYASDPEVTRYLTITRPERLADTQQGIIDYFIPKRLETWAIVEKISDKVIGTIDLRLNGDQAVFGWVLNRKYWGQGIMPEAASTLRDFAFNELKLKVLTADHNADNPKSGRVMEKIGMTKIGQIWIYVARDEKSVLCDYWALTRDDYKELKKL